MSPTIGPEGQLRIAMLAPPWIPVPPPAYGGIESVVAMLCDALVDRGHHVTLFAAPGSRSRAEVCALLDAPHPDSIERSLFEADHVARAFEYIDAAAERGEPFDVVHDHCGFTAFAMADRLSTPVVHTLHGPFTPETADFYTAHAPRGDVVAISRSQLADAPECLSVAGVIPNPIVAADWPLVTEKDDYLLWIGRLNDDKGPHRAIEVARRAGRRLILAGPVQPGNEEFFRAAVEPHIDGDRVRYIGEVGGDDKIGAFSRASALLMPITWPEPFGMVMIEAMACGTPVLAYPFGAAGEIVIDGENGYLVEDVAEMADAVGTRLASIDPARCRETAVSRFDVAHVAELYEQAYRRVLAPV